MCMELEIPFNGLEVCLNLSIHWNQCVVCAYLSAFIDLFLEYDSETGELSCHSTNHFR